MFTGIIQEVGQVDSVQAGEQGALLRILSRLLAESLQVGDSVSVDGVCLTVERFDASGFDVVASPETLRLTTLGSLSSGTAVNLEASLTPSDRLGGHWVQGHVDGVGRIRSIRQDGNSTWVEVEAPKHILAHCVYKGSIALDGVSLTVAGQGNGAFQVVLIPHTLSATHLSQLAVGDTVNLENDIISKYVQTHVQRHLQGGSFPERPEHPESEDGSGSVGD